MGAAPVKPCVLIPCYDHAATLGAVLDGLQPLALPCFVVDDGSNEENRSYMDGLLQTRPWVRLERRSRNGGRGAALKTGYRLAGRLGFTHAVQLDADGQHDPNDVSALLDAARDRPNAIVLGNPVFDGSAPAARRYGRWISRVWVWIETRSVAVRDPLCGLRCLPLIPLLNLLELNRCGDHMEFDTEIAVRLIWAGHPVVNVPVRVRYFSDGLSHFHMLWDNLRISWLHTRLSLNSLSYVPRLLVTGGSRT